MARIGFWPRCSLVALCLFAGLRDDAGMNAMAGPTMPVLEESFAAPGAASQLCYSQQYGLLFMRNSGSAIRIVDTTTHAQIDVHLANETFTDMDLTPDGVGSVFATSGLSTPSYIAIEPSATPEPSTLVLLGAAALGLLGRVWRRRRPA